MGRKKKCCNKRVIKKGIIYGLIPHCTCFLFILFTLIGITTISGFLKLFLTNALFPYIFIGISVSLPLITTYFYLKKESSLSFNGLKNNYKYIVTLFSTVLIINLIVVKIIFPTIINYNNTNEVKGLQTSKITLEVDIPCPAHAFLIIEELQDINGITNVQYRLPNFFDISYSQEKIDIENILSIEIFKEFEGKIIN